MTNKYRKYLNIWNCLISSSQSDLMERQKEVYPFTKNVSEILD